MAYRVKAYTLREESTESGTRLFFSFRTGRANPTSWKCRNSFFMEFSADGAQEQESFLMGRAAQGV